jgi:cell division protein FtsW
VITLIGASMLSRDNARRVGVLLAAAMLLCLFLVPVLGHEVNGAKRWINLGMRFQPSEFLKPGFAVALAWIMSWKLRDPNLPVLGIVSGLMVLVGLLLMLQPNLGATLLFGGVWFVLVLLSGVSVQRIGMLIGGGVGLMTLAYFFYPNAQNRINDFLGGGTAFDQVDLAQRTLLAGGWTGSGYALGVRKLNLPEAHTDYIFSVIGEEFGLITCGIIVILYLAIIARVLVRLADEENLFTLLAGAGLATQIGGQAFINILVNLQLFPSKGMTLPLVSYGGSSTIAVCLAAGLLLAITRKNPFLTREMPGLRTLLPRKGTRS